MKLSDIAWVLLSKHKHTFECCLSQMIPLIALNISIHLSRTFWFKSLVHRLSSRNSPDLIWDVASGIGWNEINCGYVLLNYLNVTAELKTLIIIWSNLDSPTGSEMLTFTRKQAEESSTKLILPHSSIKARDLKARLFAYLPLGSKKFALKSCFPPLRYKVFNGDGHTLIVLFTQGRLWLLIWHEIAFDVRSSLYVLSCAEVYRAHPNCGQTCECTLILLICLLWVASAMYNSSGNSLFISAYKLTQILSSSWISIGACTQRLRGSTSASAPSRLWERDRKKTILCFGISSITKCVKKKKRKENREKKRPTGYSCKNVCEVKLTPHCCAFQL